MSRGDELQGFQKKERGRERRLAACEIRGNFTIIACLFGGGKGYETTTPKEGRICFLGWKKKTTGPVRSLNSDELPKKKGSQ